jgi:hypothetical protein
MYIFGTTLQIIIIDICTGCGIIHWVSGLQVYILFVIFCDGWLDFWHSIYLQDESSPRMLCVALLVPHPKTGGYFRRR